MSIEYRPTRVTAIAAGNDGRLAGILDDWLAAAHDDGDWEESASFNVDAQTDRIKVHRGGNQSRGDARAAVDDWVAVRRRLKIDGFSVHDYPQTIEIWRRFEIKLRDGAYVATFVEAIGGYKVIGANGVEICSVSVGPEGWAGTSRSVDSAWSATTTERRDAPREAFSELLLRLGFKA